ncbi:MAG: hypothetical protein LBL55_01695 [Propionibacteriaceae bacterium]|jgi:hypothetical protein|nr:hypothetical protein [Propionibacteriaceae bacterium]
MRDKGRNARLGRSGPRFRPLPDDGILDDVAIDRAMAGERLPLTRAEAETVARALGAAGRSAPDIAALLGCGQTTVKKWWRSVEQETAQL